MQDLPATATYRAIGLMSGSSLDGLDIACCDFTFHDGRWTFAIPHAVCVAYDPVWVERLRRAHTLDAKFLWQLHCDFGHFCGRSVKDFIDNHGINGIDLIGSHGHTVFHFPQNGFTTQIGDGAALAVTSGLPVVCDFRSTDVAKGGQGAPLVPIGDTLLFSDYKFLLNIGGIANITVQHPGQKTIAFDVCSANQVLNIYAQREGQEFDRNGDLAKSGQVDAALFNRLNGLDYYKEPYPKSLDNGYSRDVVLPLIEQSSLSSVDKLCTFCEHIAYQIASQIAPFNPMQQDRMLVSGGGALNEFLMQRIRYHVAVQSNAADPMIINYKEALVFAFLGVLRWRREANILASVTGARADSCGGAVYLP